MSQYERLKWKLRTFAERYSCPPMFIGGRSASPKAAYDTMMLESYSGAPLTIPAILSQKNEILEDVKYLQGLERWRLNGGRYEDEIRRQQEGGAISLASQVAPDVTQDWGHLLKLECGGLDYGWGAEAEDMGAPRFPAHVNYTLLDMWRYVRAQPPMPGSYDYVKRRMDK